MPQENLTQFNQQKSSTIIFSTAGFCILFILLCFALILAPGSGVANPSSEKSFVEGSGDKQIKIRSDEMVLKSLENRALFKGHVVVEQGTMVLQADEVLLVLKEREKGSSIPSGFSLLSPQQNHEIEKIEAKGHVVFHEGNRRARSERAEYFREKDVLVLTGEPEVWEGDSHVTGSKITILLHERRSIVEQSRMVLHPQ